jgi:hypothetical protein
VTEEFITQLKEAALRSEFVINENKTKYMKISRNITDLEEDLVIGGRYSKEYRILSIYVP